MANYKGGWGAAKSNPAAPAGLSQTAARFEKQTADYKSGASKFQPWLPKESMLETAKTWYTGANAASTENGWNTDFWKQSWNNYDTYYRKAEESGRGSTFFRMFDATNEQRTGVAMWDDPNGQYKFGDVFLNGQRAKNEDGTFANLYQDYDKPTADVMMGEFMFDRSTKAQIFAGDDRQDKMAEAVDKRRQEWTDQAKYAESAERFQADVDARQKRWHESGAADIGTAAGGFVVGSATGAGAAATIAAASAALGFSWTGPGALVAAVIAGTVSAVGAWMNRDQIVELSANAWEVTDQARKYGDGNALTTAGVALGQAAAPLGRLAMPLSNIWQGSIDAWKGETGDMESEFYAVDSQGRRKVGNLGQGIDIGLSIGDGALQFSSTAAATIYKGTMAMAVTGGLTDQALGATFNPSQGQFDPFDTGGERAAALGSTGIDVAQMGMAHALGRGAASARASVMGGTTAEKAAAASKWNVSERLTGKFDDLAARRTTKGKGPGFEKESVETWETVNGIRFGLDDELNVVAQRMTVQALVPSEFMRWLPTTWKARNIANSRAGRGIGEVTRDDMYQAAWEMTNKGSRFRDALINGYAEGSEEFVQAILEPMSTGDRASMEEVVSATLYGAAGGVGMSLGRINARPTGEKFNEQRARALTQVRVGRALSDEEWSQTWSEADAHTRRQMYTATRKETREIEAMLSETAEKMAMDATRNSTIGVENLSNLSKDKFDDLHARATEEGQGSVVLMPMASTTITLPNLREVMEFAPNAAVMSAFEAANQIGAINAGMNAQRKGIQSKIDEAQEELDTLKGLTTDQAQNRRDFLNDQIKEKQEWLADLEALAPHSDFIAEYFRRWYRSVEEQKDPAKIDKMIEFANMKIKQAYEGRWKDDKTGQLLPPEVQAYLQRTVELTMGRHPFINEGSFALVVPQISKEMTHNNVHSTINIHQSLLKAINGDHDGDTGVFMHGEYLPLNEREDRRKGTQYVKEVPVETDHGIVKRLKMESDVPDNEPRYIRLFHEAALAGSNFAKAKVHLQLNELLDQLKEVLSDEHGGPVPEADFNRLTRAFRQGILDGVADSREEFINDLLNLDAALLPKILALNTHKDVRGAPIIPWMMGTINHAFNRLQRTLATEAATNPDTIAIAQDAEIQPDTTYQHRISVVDAANAGQALMGTIDPTRAAQQLYYSGLYRTLTLAGARETELTYTTPEQEDLVAKYVLLGSDMTQSEMDQLMGKDAIERRVLMWLDKMVEESTRGTQTATPKELRLLMANMEVPDIQVSDQGGYMVAPGRITLLQLLMRKSLEIEERRQEKGKPDAAIMLRINKLKGMVHPSPDGHSYTASTAMVEIFGGYQMQELVGDASMFLGSQMTLSQLVKHMTAMSPNSRNQLTHNLKRSGAYIKEKGLTDPPWHADALFQGKVNAFAMVLDAAKTHVDTSKKSMALRDKTVGEQFRKGHMWLGTMLDTHAKRNPGMETKTREGRVKVLRDLLQTSPQVVQRLSALIPEAASLGVFEINKETGEVNEARWLEDVLVNTDQKKAEVDYYVMTKLAEWNVLGGTTYRDPEDKEMKAKVGTIQYGRINSRFLQTVYHLAKQPGGFELAKFMRTATEASSLEDLFQQINDNEMWRNDRERLLPYHDDVGLFELKPEDLWSPKLPGTLQREALELWGTSMEILGKDAVEAQTVAVNNRAVLKKMVQHRKGDINDAQAAQNIQWLEDTIRNRQRYPDSIGPQARDMLLELFQHSLIRLHDKGKIDEAARPFGESLVTMNGFGWKDALLQEVDSLTAFDWEDIQTNLTKLVDGPVEIQLDDGSTLSIDMSNTDAALAMLADERTQQFAMAVLFPSVRDVNSQGVLQTYSDSIKTDRIEQLLEAENFRDQLYGDTVNPTEQAWRYIGTIEASLIKNNLAEDDQDVQDAAFHPIQHLIDDFMVAYTHGPKWATADKNKLRDRLARNIADTIKEAAMLPPDVVPSVRELVLAALQKEFTGEQYGIDMLLKSPMEQEIAKDAIWDMVREGFKAQRKALKSQLKRDLASETDPARREALEDAFYEKSRALQAAEDAQLEGTEPLPVLLQNGIDHARRAYKLDGVNDAAIKKRILADLGKRNRVNRFRVKGDIELYKKVVRAIYGDPLVGIMGDQIEDEEWEILGTWAASARVSEMTTRSSSEVAQLPLSFDPKDVSAKYFDASYGYLVDGLFNEMVLNEARKLAKTANTEHRVTTVDFSRLLTDGSKGLFAPGYLGVWTDRIPLESMKMRKVVETASTGAAIQIEGNDPKEFQPYLGSAKVSTKVPGDEFLTTKNIPGVLEKSGRFTDFNLTGLQGAFLQGAFVKSIRLEAIGSTALAPEDQDLSSVLLTNEFNEEVKNSPYKVLDLDRLDARLAEIAAKYDSPTVQVVIEYVDGNKQPSGPKDREWANNIFFEGVGRQSYSTATFGALAALFFGVNGLSKLGQQNPLDAATKKGKRFRQHVVSTLAQRDRLEQTGNTVAEILMEKAVWMLDQSYPNAELIPDDINALYKLMKMRHVIVGKNASGQQEVWWPDRWIEWETKNNELPPDQRTAPPLTDMKLVKLNESIAQELRGGGAGQMGLRSRVTRRTLNMHDIDPFPSLDNGRLKKLGLTRLGQDARASDSPLAQVMTGPRAHLSREQRAQTNIIKQRRARWMKERDEANQDRMRTRQTGAGKMDIGRITRQNIVKMNQFLAPEVVSGLMRKLGVPFADLEGKHFSITRMLLGQVRRLMGDSANTVVWYHDHESGTDPSEGLLGRLAPEENFESLGKSGPAYSDVVAINVSSIERTAGAEGKDALNMAKDVVRSYAERGLIISLVADNGRRDTINDLYLWLETGQVGYRSVAGSPNFFAPTTEDPEEGATRRALNSTNRAVHQFETRGVALGLVTNEYDTALSENGAYVDVEHDPGIRRVSSTILPTEVMATGSVGDSIKYSFSYPNSPEQWEKMRALLLPKLNDEAWIDHFIKISGGKKGNPEGRKIARYNKNTGIRSPGVQDAREALYELRDILEANGDPAEEGRTLQMGSFLPTLGMGDSVLLTRVGFRVPDMQEMPRQMATALGATKPEQGVPGTNIAIAPARLDKNVTVPPPFMVQERKKGSRGLVVIGEYELSPYSKTILEGTGMKLGAVAMPEHLKFKDAVMRAPGGAGVRVTRITSEKGIIGKEATPGLTDNFRDIFAVSGVSFEPHLLKWYYGADEFSSWDAATRAKKWDDLSAMLDAWAQTDTGLTESDIIRILDNDLGASEFETTLSAVFQGLGMPAVSLRANPQDPNADADLNRLVSCILGALQTPGIKLQHVIGTPGLMSVASHNDGLLVTQMPAILTDTLADSAYPGVRQMLIDMANANMPKDANGKTIYWWDKQLQFHAIVEENGTDREIIGQLQIQVPVLNDTTSDTIAMAALEPNANVSPHIVNVQNATGGGYETTKPRKKDPKTGLLIASDMDEIFGDNKILRFEDSEGSMVWDMLTRLEADDLSYQPWGRVLPMVAHHYENCNEQVRLFTTRIDLPDDTAEQARQATKAYQLADKMLNRLGLNKPNTEAHRDEIDYLVRQFLGAPGPAKVDEEEASLVTAEEYIQAVQLMMHSIEDGLHPLHGADVPYEHVAFWRKVFDAQKFRDEKDRWAPLKRTDDKKIKEPANSWDEWEATLREQVVESTEAFGGMFANALDGFMHTHQGAAYDFITMPLSLNQGTQAKLMDPEVNRAYLSVDPGREALLKDPVIIDSMLVSYDALTGDKPELLTRDSLSAKESPRAQRLQRKKEWLQKNKATRQKEISVREYARRGLERQESERKTSELLAGMVNMSITMRLANPALYVSAWFEVPFRNMLERTTSVLTGQYTGAGAALLTRAGEKFNVTPRYTVEEQAQIDRLVRQLGQSTTLLGEIFREMVYANPMQAKSRVGRVLERAAGATARATSDPRWGMKANSVARRYVEAALEHLAMTDSHITVAQFAQLLENDPLWLMKNAGDGVSAHRMGVNRVTQVRSTRPTMAGTAIMKPIEKMTQSGAGTVNLAGHLLKLPFMFTRFNVNMLATLTGLDSLDQVAAMFMDGRQAPQLMKRLGALARRDEYDAEDATVMDFSEVLQGIDLSRVFIRGAVTQTGLMAAALMAGGFSLGGDDEEERRRKRLAKYLNVPFIRDPREAQNDFRWRDAVFLDNVPVLGTWYRNADTGRSAVVPHWILRQFLSPVLGTMRFFETGNLSEITSGFWDAAAAIPYSALNLWRQADETANLLAAAAQDASLDPQKDQQVNQFIINFVGMYEKALFENAFVNNMRQALDEYDRNPWLVARTAEENTGELDRRQGTDVPQETNALVDVQTTGEGGQEPENRKSYLGRDAKDAQIHAYAEGNATFSLLMSVFTGGSKSTYLRRNMVPKGRTAAIDETTKAEFEALVNTAFMGQGGQPQLSKRELGQLIQKREQDAGRWWDQAEVDAEVDAIYEAQKSLTYEPPTFDEEGKAILQGDHDKGVFKSLAAGAIQFGDPLMSGYWASDATREAVAREWLDEIVQEGLALGLTETSAKYRADRFWWGDEREGWVGLRELIWSNKIPKKGEAEYLQKNATYIIGPDGHPWATPFTKATLLGGAFPVPNKMIDPGEGLKLDKRGNVIDPVKGINTGLAGLTQLPQEPEKFEPNDDILDEVKDKSYDDDGSGKRYGWTRWPRRSYGGYRRYGGGGGGYSGGSSYGPPFQRMQQLPNGFAQRLDDIPFINSNNPIIRRSRVNRERITSERGRLKQWQ